jgi:hypothetical protein
MRSGTENEWCELVFSGAGIVLIGGVGRWLYRKFRKPKAPETPKPEPPLTQVSSEAVGDEAQANSLAIGAGTSVSAPALVGNTQQVIKQVSAEPQHIAIQNRKPSLPTADQIRKQQRDLPPATQGEFVEKFINSQIQWPARLGVVQKFEDYFLLVCSYGADSTTDIGFFVPVAKYPTLSLAKTGHRVWIEGTICDVTPTSFQLRDVALEFE